jgi:hypothetical protein
VNTGYSCHLLTKLKFSQQIKKNTQTSNFMKIRPVATKLFHADEQTDGQTGIYKKASSRFRNFAKATETPTFTYIAR